MFITEAYAQAAGGGPGGMLGGLLPLIAIIPIFYFLVWAPQRKRMKEHKAMIAAVKRGDRIVSAGGIIGVISKVVDESEVQLEISEGVKVRLLRSSINDVLNRTEPAKATQDNAPEKAEKGEKKGDGR
jgi:preprotein translocase subunit YajC